ncbi:TPA: ATP-binding cassette domain-containing protein [Clostridium perfringens]
MVILYFGITEIIAGNLTIGEFTILSLYFSNIMNSIKYFLVYSNEFQNVKAAYNRILEWLSIDVEQNAELVINKISDIRIENLIFGYPDNNLLYKGLNYTFSSGNIYQIKGVNGSGKSTLINILIGLYNNNFEGNVIFNNISIKNLNMYNIRTNLIGVTEQEPILLQDSIFNNITYNINEIDKLKMKEYIKILNLELFIENLPNGINTEILSKNYNLSGGEKQKLSLLRTLLKNPDLIILDEVTSALDKSTTNNLKSLIESIKEDKIIIIIDHNDNFKDIVDFVIDIDELRVNMDNKLTRERT